MRQIAVIGQGSLTPFRAPLFGRFFAKLVDVLPAALASLIGGFLFTQYQAGYRAAPQPLAEQVAPASAEMLQLVREEHAMILDYLNAQTAAEKSRNAAADREDARAVAEAAAATSPRRVPVVAAAPIVSPLKVPAVAATPAARAPRIVAPAEQTNGGAPAAAALPQSDSLLAKTLTIKDHVVHATLHAVAAIGGIPNWIASFGDRLGGANTNAPSSSRLISAS
ncbi:MAG TPA: hypothetical protein VK442_02400 [Xanthobacteraceae bacterium]|nr:hypothetical protein [Xanthobacteraceae bacterium]